MKASELLEKLKAGEGIPCSNCEGDNYSRRDDEFRLLS